MDDLQAIRRLKNGDIGGLESLIACYQAKALRTAFLITQDEMMAVSVNLTRTAPSSRTSCAAWSTQP
jgi:hypothetical protein